MSLQKDSYSETLESESLQRNTVTRGAAVMTHINLQCCVCITKHRPYSDLRWYLSNF